MAVVFFHEPIIATKPKVEGPSVSISFRRGQVSFSEEAAKMMGFEIGKTFIEVGFDDETKQLVFVVSKESAPYKAKVENFLVQARKVNVPVIYIWSALNSISGVSTETAQRYPLYSGDGRFYINFAEGVEKPKSKSKPKKKAEAKAVTEEASKKS